MSPHADCYGRLFPPVGTIVHHQDVAGKVFGYRVDHPGVTSTGHKTSVNLPAWEECGACADFDRCYRLSLGTLLTELATRG